MVSIRYQREQQEEAARKERLLAARRAAAEVSIRNARRYVDERHQQQVAVRGEAEARWAKQNYEQRMVVQQLLEEGAARQGQGMRQAAVVRERDWQEAHREADAWEAERRLETARGRLAVAAHRVERRQTDEPREAVLERKRLVREREDARAARVAASPRGPTYADVQSQLAPVCTEEERRLLAHRGRAAGGVVGGLPRSLVDVPPPEQRYPFDATTAAQEVGRQAEVERTAHEQAIQRQREAATHRAAEALREQRRAEVQQERERQARLERQRAAATTYRHPRPPSPALSSDEGACGNEEAVGQNLSPYARVSAETHPATHRQHVMQAVRQAEEEFERVFLRGPPVLLHEEVPLPDSAPRTLAELLRPATLGDLLPKARAPPADAAPAVTPCRFETQPIVIHMDADPLVDDEVQGEEPSNPSTPAESVATCERPTLQSTQDVQGDMEPSTAAVPQQTAGVSRTTTERPQTPPPPPHMSSDISRISVPVDQGLLPTDISRLTAPVDVSLSSAGSGDSTTEEKHRGAVDARSTPAPAATSSCSSADTTSSSTSVPDSLPEEDDTDSFLTSSSASLYARPTMTAEQLRIALTRLRHRMRTAQLQ